MDRLGTSPRNRAMFNHLTRMVYAEQWKQYSPETLRLLAESVCIEVGEKGAQGKAQPQKKPTLKTNLTRDPRPY